MYSPFIVNRRLTRSMIKRARYGDIDDVKHRQESGQEVQEIIDLTDLTDDEAEQEQEQEQDQIQDQVQVQVQDQDQVKDQVQIQVQIQDQIQDQVQIKVQIQDHVQDQIQVHTDTEKQDSSGHDSKQHDHDDIVLSHTKRPVINRRKELGTIYAAFSSEFPKHEIDPIWNDILLHLREMDTKKYNNRNNNDAFAIQVHRVRGG